MFDIDGVLVTLDIIEKYFCCDLEACKGACCVEGDAGAPVTDEEVVRIEAVSPIRPVAYKDPSGELVTSIIDGKDCVFATHKNGCTICSLYGGPEPISCRLYPIREVRVGKRVGLEYHRWDICHPAQIKGRKNKIRLYQFLKEPLIARFGQTWYDELCLTADEWFKQSK